MNEVIKNILSRRSIRDFTSKKIEKSDLETIINTGLYAPTGMNKQTWNFFGILNQDVINEFAQAIATNLNRPGYKFYGSPAIIIVSNEIDSKWGRDDNACALQNMMLASHSLNIGSVWINQLTDCCDMPEIRALLTKTGIPENHTVYGVVALGYTDSPARGIVDKNAKITIIE